MTKQRAKLSAPFIAATLWEGRNSHIASHFLKTVWKQTGEKLLYIPLPRLREENHFYIPEPFQREYLFLHIPERHRKDGGATVICGFKGKKLRSYLPERPTMPWHITGWILAQGTAFTVTAFPDSGTVRITERSILRTGMDTVRIEEDRLYDGPIVSLPYDMESYREAINMALTKAEHPDPGNRIMYYHRFKETKNASID